MNKKFLISIILLMLAGTILSWFIMKEEENFLNQERILRLGGATTLYSFARHAADAYMDKNPDILITVGESNSGGGIKRLISNEVDIAHIARFPTPKEHAAAKQKGLDLKVTVMGKDAVAVIVHPTKHKIIKRITKDQIRKIFFTGTITDWSQLDPQLSGKINIYTRNIQNSGVAALFVKKITDAPNTPYAAHTQSIQMTPLIVPTLADDPQGIAYAPIKWIDARVKILAFGKTLEDAILPSEQTIKNNQYLLTRKLTMVHRKNPTDLVKKFIQFITGPQGRQIWKAEGFYKI